MSSIKNLFINNYRRRALKIVAAFVVFAVIGLYLTTFFQSRNLLEHAREFRSEKNWILAIDEYRKAVSWRSPGNSFARDAATELFELSQSPELSKDEQLEALYQLKRGFMSSRSFLHPENESSKTSLLAEVEKEIISRAGGGEAPRIRELYPAEINYGWQAIAQLCFWGWVISFMGAVWCGFSKEGRPEWRSLSKMVVMGVAWYALWLVSLSLA